MWMILFDLNIKYFALRNFNEPTEKIWFMVDCGDTFSILRYQYYIAGSLSKKSGGSEYPAGVLLNSSIIIV